MFLKHRNSTVRDDSGSSIVAVIGMVAVAAVITTVVTASTVQALNYTTSTRAGVQAKAAADAGVEYLAARLAAQSCEASAVRNYGQVYTSAVLAAEAAALGEASVTLADMGVTASDPYFDAEVEYRSTVAGSPWVPGCPPTTIISNQLDYEVRIASTGYAAAEGTGGVSGLDEHSVLASYGWKILTREEEPPPPPTQITASGPAVYAYSSEGFGGSGTLISVAGSAPGVLIKEGTVTCNGASAGIVDIVAGEGDITVNGSCKVDGNVWASGKATIDGGTGVGGHVIAAGVVASRPIGGSIWSTGDVKLTHGNTVGGTVTARNLDTAGVTISKNVVANGSINAVQTSFGAGINATGDVTLRDLTMNGKVVGKRLTLDGGVTVRGVSDIYGPATATNGWASSVQNITASEVNFSGGNQVNGTKTIRAASSVPAGALTQNPATPARPGVPDWIDFDYDVSDWTGFTEVKLTGACTGPAIRTAIAGIAGPVLVNGFGCSNGVTIGGDDKVPLNRDVAIFANRFDLGGSGGFTSTENARLWLVEPDNVKPSSPGHETQPNCVNQSFTLGGGFSFAEKLDTMIYTPCRMELASSTVLKGQIYAGKVTIAGGSQLKYVRVGLPGVDLDTGGNGPTEPVEPQPPIIVVTGTELGTVLDYRDAPRS